MPNVRHSQVTKINRLSPRGHGACPVTMNVFTRSLHRALPTPRHSFPRSPSLIPKRFLGIPSAFLLDEYIPRYFLLSSVDEAKKRSLAYAHLRECNLCPRKCGVNRYETTGTCLIGAETAKVNVIAPHRGEEPCIQGFHGSGSVFFSGCNLRCVFCQNHVRLRVDIVTQIGLTRVLGYCSPTQRIRSYARRTG